MSDRISGWLFVAAQALLLGVLIVLPTRSDFALPDWASTSLNGLFWFGVVLAVVAGLTLGRSLTATPVPTKSGELRTGGLYRFVRHPIYTGVILIVIALSVRPESFIGLVIGALTLVFFNAKAGWEEARLAERYPNYRQYAARTPRFVPNPLHRNGPHR